MSQWKSALAQLPSIWQHVIRTITLRGCFTSHLLTAKPPLSSPNLHPINSMKEFRTPKELEAYVFSKAFDEECNAAAERLRSKLGGSHSDSDVASSWSGHDKSTSSAEPSFYDIPKLEANLYYAGIHGPDCRGPKLIYRTKTDKARIVPPTGLEGRDSRHLVKPRTVPESHAVGKDGLWDHVRNEVVKLLDERGMKLTSVDLLRDGAFHTNPATIWVGVIPGALTSEVAHRSANDILELLKKHGLTDVEVAYRESQPARSR